MKKKFASVIVAGIAATTLGVASVSDTASAATPREGAKCVASGVRFLASNGLLRDAFRQKVDYAPLDVDGTGDIRIDLGDEAFLPLSTVIKLHYTDPELFSWCD